MDKKRKQEASSMASTSIKSFSTTDIGTRCSTAQISVKSSLSTPNIKYNEDLQGEDLAEGPSRATPSFHDMKQLQCTSKTQNAKKSLFSLLQGGNAPKINMVFNNLFIEKLRPPLHASEEADFEMKGTGPSSSRKRGFPKSHVRDFENRYPLKCPTPNTKEHQSKTKHLAVSPLTCASQSTTRAGGINQLWKFSGKFNADFNSFQIPKPSCGPNLESDDEAAWADVPLDALSAMAEANDISQVLRQADKSKRRASRISKKKLAAAASRSEKKKFAAKRLTAGKEASTTATFKKVASTTAACTSKKVATTYNATASKREATKKRTRRRYVILKAARRKTNPKFLDVKQRFLKRRKRLRTRKNGSSKPNNENTDPKVKPESNWLTISDSLDEKSGASVASSELGSGSGSELGSVSGSSSGSELGSKSGSASGSELGSGSGGASGTESDEQPPPSASTYNARKLMCKENKREHKAWKPKANNKGKKQKSTNTLAKYKSSKVKRRRESNPSSMAKKSSKAITPKLWQDFIKTHCCRKPKSASNLPKLFAVGKVELRAAVIVDHLKTTSSESSQSTTEVASSYGGTSPVPRCATPQIIQYYSSIPGQDRSSVGSACEDMENAKFSTSNKPGPSRQLPLWCTKQTHHKIAPNTICCHGSKSTGVAAPVAKRPRLAQSVSAPATSRPLKRKLDACDNESSIGVKVRRGNQNVLILRNSDLNSEEAVKGKAPKRKAPPPGFFGRILRAAKRLFTGEIKET